MTKTVAALFDSHTAAYSAVQDLVDHGFARDTVGVLAHEATSSDDRVTTAVATPDRPSGVARGAGVGAALGGVGGLLAGLTTLAVPGVGSVVVAGLLAMALGGAGVGAVVGGHVGALSDLGIPREHVRYYSDRVRRGDVLVVVATTEEMTDLAMRLLSHHHPVDLRERAEEWRAGNSSRLDRRAEV